MNYIFTVCLLAVIYHSCDASYEYLYDQDDTDLGWLYGNEIYGQEYRNFDLNPFNDYLPNSYRKSIQYRPIVSYQPRAYFVGHETPQWENDWPEVPPLYLTYKTLPHVDKKPVYFAPALPPTTEQPSSIGYHYPKPEVKYLPPSKEPIPFATTKQPDTPKTDYLPPKTIYLPPKPVYLPPKTEYLPPTSRKPTTQTITTTTRRPTTTTLKPSTPKPLYLPPFVTKTTLKPSTPKSLYLPPIVVPSKPSVVGEYLPPVREIAPHLQPPPVSSGKPIRFN